MLYALNAPVIRSRARMANAIPHFALASGGGNERKRTLLVLNLDRYYFDNQSEEYPNIMFIVVDLKTSEAKSSILTLDYTV